MQKQLKNPIEIYLKSKIEEAYSSYIKEKPYDSLRLNYKDFKPIYLNRFKLRCFICMMLISITILCLASYIYEMNPIMERMTMLNNLVMISLFNLIVDVVLLIVFIRSYSIINDTYYHTKNDLKEWKTLSSNSFKLNSQKLIYNEFEQLSQHSFILSLMNIIAAINLISTINSFLNSF
jgi:hypothetical protein